MRNPEFDMDAECPNPECDGMINWNDDPRFRTGGRADAECSEGCGWEDDSEPDWEAIAEARADAAADRDLSDW